VLPIPIDRHGWAHPMDDSRKREEDEYAPYMTSIWGYLIIFLIIIPVVLYLGLQYGRYIG
jgi:hypothetical protein